MSNHKDYYAVLGVSPDADAETIENAYDRLAQEVQPDVNAEATDPERMRELDEAFDVLDDPERRAEYDRSRSGGDEETPSPVWAAGVSEAGVEATGDTASVDDADEGRETAPDETAPAADVEAPPAKEADRRLVAGIALLVAGVATMAAAVVVLVLALTNDNGGGTTVTASGLQYTDTAVGSGASPQSGQVVTLHFTAKLQDGTTVGSSTGQTPLAFVAGNAPIKGLDEGVSTMAVGGTRTLVMPPDLAFGAKGTQGIPPNATVTFDVELLAISDPPADKPPEVSGEKKDLESGLVAIDIVDGDGDEAATGDTVYVHYTGWLEADGTQFDSSLKRARVFNFTIGQKAVIRGWDAGVPGMKVGGKRRLIVPAPLGYGDQAQGDKIPANSNLIFDIELIGVSKATGTSPSP